MVKKSETNTTQPILKMLSGEDKRLIAELCGKTQTYVYMVLKGSRNNEQILKMANNLIEEKKKLKSSLIKTAYREEMIEPHLNHA